MNRGSSRYQYLFLKHILAMRMCIRIISEFESISSCLRDSIVIELTNRQARKVGEIYLQARPSSSR